MQQLLQQLTGRPEVAHWLWPVLRTVIDFGLVVTSFCFASTEMSFFLPYRAPFYEAIPGHPKQAFGYGAFRSPALAQPAFSPKLSKGLATQCRTLSGFFTLLSAVMLLSPYFFIHSPESVCAFFSGFIYLPAIVTEGGGIVF